MRALTAAVERICVDRFLAWEGSTRSSAILRICCVLLLWSRFGGHTYDPWRDPTPDHLALCALFWIGTPLLLVGLWTRLAALVTVIPAVGAHYWLGWHRGVEPLQAHHVYTLGALAVLVACLPSGRSFSVDRWLALRRAEREGVAAPAERGPLWGLRLVAITTTVMYVGTAWEKSTLSYVDGSAMEMVWLSIYFGSDAPRIAGFHALTVVASDVVLALEWTLPVALWFPRLRPTFVVLGVLLHAAIYWFIPVATFTATMYALYLAFLDPEEVHRVTERIA